MLSIYRYTLAAPPNFENFAVTDINSRADLIVRRYSIPVLTSICLAWPKLGERFQRAQVCELPVLSKFSIGTANLYATLITTWAVKKAASYQNRGEFSCGLEIDPQGTKKYHYIRTAPGWLNWYIEEEEKKRGIEWAEDKKLQDEFKSYVEEKPGEALRQHGILPGMGLGLEAADETAEDTEKQK